MLPVGSIGVNGSLLVQIDYLKLRGVHNGHFDNNVVAGW